MIKMSNRMGSLLMQAAQWGLTNAEIFAAGCAEMWGEIEGKSRKTLAQREINRAVAMGWLVDKRKVRGEAQVVRQVWGLSERGAEVLKEVWLERTGQEGFWIKYSGDLMAAKERKLVRIEQAVRWQDRMEADGWSVYGQHEGRNGYGNDGDWVRMEGLAVKGEERVALVVGCADEIGKTVATLDVLLQEGLVKVQVVDFDSRHAIIEKRLCVRTPMITFHSPHGEVVQKFYGT